MGKVREHDPIIIEEINGLWARGDDETCPSDHLLLADNVQFIHSGVETRQAIKPYAQIVSSANLTKVKRVYTYTTQFGQSLLVLVQGGTLYHVLSPTEIYNILNITAMEDFAFIAIAGRAYISPFRINTTLPGPDGSTQTYALGLPDQCVYVYSDDPTLPGNTGARPAAGNPPKNADANYPAGKKPFQAYASRYAGTVTKGHHAFGITYNGGVIGPEVAAVASAPGDKCIELINIPIGVGGVTSRTIVMTKADAFKPEGGHVWYNLITIPDNVTTNFRIDITDAGLTTVYVPGVTPAPTTGALGVKQDTVDGFCDLGFHLVGVVYETNTGYLTAPGPEFFGGQTYTNEKKAVKITNVPVSTDYFVTKRHIVSTKAIPEYNGDQKGYQFFFVPKGTLENNTATEITVNYYDSDLIADASHLIDNFSRIPAGVNFCEYHGRLVLVGDASYPKKLDGTPDTKKPDNRSVAWVSAAGEPEAINQIDGLIITPLDGTPLTNCQNFRDNLFLFKQNRTFAVTDNGDDPTTWGPVDVLDQGIGASVHGIAEVLDSGGVNVDYLIIVDYSGLMLFNGTYARPELSWKIENIWVNWWKDWFHNIQIVNDTIHKKLWIMEPVFPGRILYLADYANGLNPKDIRWAKWWFDSNITSIALYRTDKLIVGTWQS